MRLLFLRGGALGDLLVTLPAIAAAHAKWPDATIELVGNATAAQLAINCRLLDAAHSQHEARWGALYGERPLPAELAGWLRRFDVIVNFWPDPGGELSKRFPLAPRQTCVSADAQPETGPAAAHFCAPLLRLGANAGSMVYPLRTPAPSRSFIALHPGSGSSRKNWPLDRWTALAHWLERELGLGVLVVSGEAESATILPGSGEPLRSRPLDEVADRLAACRLFIGHDSGIAHLAASVGIPSVLLFGPTDPAIWAPPAGTVRVIRNGPDLASISLAEVKAAVSAALRDQS